MVPIHLDVLYLERETSVVEAMADFSRLPYQDGTRDVNSEIANISEEIVSQPFQNENLRLKPGVHLHWSLPDALTKGTQTAGGTVFPAAPNRWLVTRRVKQQAGYVAEKQWVVESDYLYPEGDGGQAGAVNIPYTPDATKGGRQPYRYLGRNLPFVAWRENSPGAQYLKTLTAVGYGEPSFAAFYPNCHSVFGFYDDDYTGNLPQGLQYDLVGWYSDSGQDYLNKFNASVTADYEKRGPKPTADDLKKELEARAGWTCDSGGEFPNQTLCYARLTFQSSPAADGAAWVNPDLGVAVGNTGTEALSAYLAYAIVKEKQAGSFAEADYQAKAQIEDQLEAVSLSERLEQLQLDIGPKFQEARHEKGFTAVPGGFIWTVSPEAQDGQADAMNADAQTEITLPDEMADLLNRLNVRQQEYDRARDEIECLRRQLFSDWYKYMLCAYPPEDARDSYPNIDEVRHYLEVKGVAPLQNKIKTTGQVQIEINGDQVIATANDSSAGSAAVKLKQAISDLGQAIITYNNSPAVRQAKVAYRLKQIPAPRYWQPNEPVVLLTGPAAKTTLRHGQDGRLNDGLLDCHALGGYELRDLILNKQGVIGKNIDQLSPGQNQEKIGFSMWTRQPWNPFLLEWEVEFFPTESDGNIDPANGDYGHGYVTENYTLAENDVDLSIKPGKGAVTRAANVYCGSTILTPNAVELSLAQMEEYLRRQLLDAYCEDLRLPQPGQPEDFFRQNIAAILNWYKNKSCKAAARPSLCNIIRAYELLAAPDFCSLAQSLGGFNDALLMHKQTLQLAVADPLGFSDYQSFAGRVRECVRESIRSAPAPLNDFNPIRAGALRVTRLRLIDTFGQFMDLDCGRVGAIEKMTLPSNPYLMALPPRLAQPARLNFRWLSAGAGEQEMNDHPATTPICGWALANNLDNSLMIYDGAGKALGVIDQLARWTPPPGGDPAIAYGAIPNPHLRKMVTYLLGQGPEFLSDFITAIDNALENIEPENYAQHQELALLMGRPLALVRASLNLELQGAPAIHQGWEMFRQDLRRPHRETNLFERVRFPVRVGEYRQYNDGLVGYWKETGGRYEDDLFYAPQTDGISHGYIKTHADDPMTIDQTAVSEPQILSMLIDPRGKVHATAGVAPCKAIDIPPDQYAEALRAIEITFLSVPILTDAGRINLPLPEEPGFNWSWLQRENGSWSEVSTAGTVNKQTFLTAFANGEAVWARLKEKGWIKEIDPAKAGVTPKDSRTEPDLGQDLKDQVATIEIILSRSYIGKVSAQATFTATQEICEGWLKLREAQG
jgi:hypothetical protein